MNDTLPANVDAEKTILGAILLDNEAFFDETAELEPDDFSIESHRRIYLRMVEILLGEVEGTTQVDLVTLVHVLKSHGEIENVGGVSYLASLTEGLPRRPVISNYIRILKEKTKLRKMMAVCGAAYERAQSQAENSESISSFLQEQLIDIGAEGADHTVSLGSIEVESGIRAKRNNVVEKRTALEFTWGVAKLDDWTRGAFKGEWTVLGGESSGGKTALAVEIVLANALEGTHCGIFSMEMTKEQLKQRFYPSMSKILTANHIRDPRLMNSHTHIPELEKISQDLARLPIYIDDTSPLRIDKLIARMRIMRRKHGIKLFVVDYLQLVRKMPKLNSIDGFEHVVFTLRDFPKNEPDCHLLVLSQYSKSVGFTKTVKRTKDSLYGGSVIHHAAQNILMISIEDPEKREDNELLDAEIRIAKQREGKRGKVNCYFDRDHLRFCELQPPLK